MKYRMILIGKSEKGGCLDLETADYARRSLLEAGGGGDVSEAVWLGENESCFFRCSGSARFSEEAQSHLDTRRVDWVRREEDGGKKSCLAADMDFTMTEVESIDVLAEACGKGAEIAAMTAHAMEGGIDFGTSLQKRAAILKGTPWEIFEKTARERIPLRAGAETLTKTMRAHGAKTLLVSGGFSIFAESVMKRAHFDSFEANRLEVENGKVTGRVLPPLCGSKEKREAMMRFAESHGIKTQEVLAVGDGANDIPMLQAAGLGVAFHAKPRTADAAAHHIKHSDLTALLYLQGYRKEEFAD